MASFDSDGYNRPPQHYDVNNRRGRLHRDRYPGLWWRQRADGTTVWEYKMDVKGQSRSRHLDADSEREAIREWEVKRGQAAKGEAALPDGKARLDDAWALYAAEMDHWVADGVIAAKTRENYLTSYRIHVQPQLGRAYVAGISRHDVIDLFRDLKAQGLADWTRCGIKIVLKHALNKAVAEGWILFSPFRDVDEKYLPKQTERAEARLLSVDELQSLFAACSDSYRQPLIVLAFTGLRRGELLGLQWQDVRLNDGKLDIQRQLLWDKERRVWFTDRTKGRRTSDKTLSRRTIALQPAALAALEQQLVVERAKGLGMDGDYVFTSSTGRGHPILPTNFGRGITKAATRAQLGHLHPHDLRHTTASILAAAGVKDHIAAAMMGHTVKEYWKTYAKAFQDDAEQAETLRLLSAAGFGQ